MTNRAAVLLAAISAVIGLTLSSAFVRAAQVVDDNGQVVIEKVTKADVSRLIEFLGGGGRKANMAEDALVGLGAQAVPGLLDALKNSGGNTAIMRILWLIKDKRAIGPLMDYASKNNEDAKGALRQYGDAAVPELARYLNDPAYSTAAIDILKNIGPSDDSRAIFRGLLKSADPRERGGAAYLLGFWRDGDSAAAIEGLIKDEDASVRESAISGYGILFDDSPDKYNVDLLLSLLKDSSPKVRDAAVELLAFTSSEKKVEPLLDVVKNEKNQRVRFHAISALENPKDARVVFPLIQVLGEKDADPHVLGTALYVLGAQKAKEALPYIEALYKDGKLKDNVVLSNLAVALTLIGERVDMTPLVSYLNKDYLTEETQQALLDVFYTLAKPGDEEVVRAVEAYKARGSSAVGLEKAQKILDKIKLKPILKPGA